MQFGYHLPIWGPAATRENLIAAARRVESLGFDSVWASDHIVIPFEIRSRYPYNATGSFPLPPTANFLEPLTALALVAGVTERLRLGTTVLVLPPPSGSHQRAERSPRDRRHPRDRRNPRDRARRHDVTPRPLHHGSPLKALTRTETDS